MNCQPHARIKAALKWCPWEGQVQGYQADFTAYDKCRAPQVQWTAGAPRHMGTSTKPRGRRSHLTKGPRAPTAPSANPIPSANDDDADSQGRLLIGAQDVSSIPLAGGGSRARR
ncbi:hypothetical protein E2C01_096664 [Portunus trituberculatus]|uniref:Uncharacterized protein n=1 Tax=Portunus trituberculatus TaxID=210409 RepID=A0A5B7K7U5_PORTR|nr:hypothetical protein [Portunus trituberculatus]